MTEYWVGNMQIRNSWIAGNIALPPAAPLGSRAMAYKIQYYRRAHVYAEVFWDDDLPDTREVAQGGLKRNQADFAIIIDLDQNARIVETLRHHA